ncbi:MAG: LON peptidase substrate-binding domain-containing protein, partial [Proteobacteria bacterium]|nr:LON peptidase substrate-binding domain-containing protein [Pseudomonadota bacterium]
MKQYILPLRDLVFQPGLTVPIYMDNPVSVQVLETAAKEQKSVVLAAQKVWNYPTVPEDLHKTGTRADILQLLRLPDGTLHVMLQTRAPVDISNIALENGLFVGDAADIEQSDDSSDYTSALRDKIAENLRFLAKTKRVNMSKLQTIISSYSLAAFIDAVIQMTDIEVAAANKILRMRAYSEKLMALLEQVSLMTEMAKIDENINKRVNQQMESGRREIYLAEKMKALQREMGEDGAEGMDAKSLHDKITETKMPKEAHEKALNEWKRMSNMSPMSAEGAVLKTYLDELLSLPWNKSDKSEIDLNAARAILDKDHTGMTGVKERILEHLAVMKKTGNSRGSILCLVGAPGVGKTSLGRS